MIINYTFSIDTDNQTFTISNPETGDSKTVDLPIKKKAKKLQEDDCDYARLIRDDNKLTLNNHAIELMNIKPGVRLKIVYNKDGRPIIGTEQALNSEGGNKLTNSLTIAYKGKANEQLASVGDTFVIRPVGNDLFRLYPPNEDYPVEIQDENLQIPDTEGVANTPDIELDIDSLLMELVDEPKQEQNNTMHALDFNLD